MYSISTSYRPILSVEQSKRIDMAFCVAHIVSSLYSTWTPSSLPSRTKVRNSIVLFLICKFYIISKDTYFFIIIHMIP